MILLSFFVNPLSANPHKMIKHTQTIRCQQLSNCLSVFDHFVGLALKGLRILISEILKIIKLTGFQNIAW